MTDRGSPPTGGGRIRRLLFSLAADVAVGVMLAALVVAIVLFSGVVSQFAYVDF